PARTAGLKTACLKGRGSNPYLQTIDVSRSMMDYRKSAAETLRGFDSRSPHTRGDVPSGKGGGLFSTAITRSHLNNGSLKHEYTINVSRCSWVID
ncbi:MAG: hypothetical protein AAFV33_11950, partial [Chloroflexota bacterium]